MAAEMKDLLLKALDAAVTDAVLKEYSGLVMGIIQEKATGRELGSALNRFSGGMQCILEAYAQAHSVIEAVSG